MAAPVLARHSTDSPRKRDRRHRRPGQAKGIVEKHGCCLQNIRQTSVIGEKGDAIFSAVQLPPGIGGTADDMIDAVRRANGYIGAALTTVQLMLNEPDDKGKDRDGINVATWVVDRLSFACKLDDNWVVTDAVLSRSPEDTAGTAEEWDSRRKPLPEQTWPQKEGE